MSKRVNISSNKTICVIVGFDVYTGKTIYPLCFSKREDATEYIKARSRPDRPLGIVEILLDLNKEQWIYADF